MPDAPPLPDRIARLLPPGARRRMVEVEGVAVHVMEGGDPHGRPVWLQHGNPTWGFLWREVVKPLKGVRWICPDLVGLGLSARVPARFHTLRRHGEVLGALADALDVDGVVLVGQDWGGPTLLRAFADRAPRVAGIVVANTVIGPPKQGFKSTFFHRFSRMPVVSDAVFRLGGFPQVALHQAQGDGRRLPSDVAFAYRWPLRGLSRNAAPLALARMVPDTLDHPSVPDLARSYELVSGWTGPAAVVWGTRDPILGRALGHTRRTLPHAPVTETDAGHFLQEQVPDALAAAIQGVVDAA
jgi:pimeloyl-ACP methyl ester carboxylesterase